MNTTTLTAIALIVTSTSAFAGSATITGQSHDACIEYNGNLSGNTTVSINGNSQRGYVVDTSTGRNCSNRTATNSNTGSSFNSDNDKSVSRVQVQGNDLVIAVTNQDPSGAYSKEHRVTLPTNTGAKGDKGDTGLQGAKGEQGNDGAKGDDGAAGAQGAKGDTGNNGQDGLQGVKGDTGSNGQDGAKGIQGVAGKDAISGLALVAALDSIKGDGIGFGLTKEEDSDFTFSTAVKFEIDNRTNVNIGITITEDGRKAASAGIGFSF